MARPTYKREPCEHKEQNAVKGTNEQHLVAIKFIIAHDTRGTVEQPPLAASELALLLCLPDQSQSPAAPTKSLHISFSSCQSSNVKKTLGNKSHSAQPKCSDIPPYITLFPWWWQDFLWYAGRKRAITKTFPERKKIFKSVCRNGSQKKRKMK